MPLHGRWLFPGVFGALAAAHLVLIWQVRLYPFVDLPNHLAEATIFRYQGAPGNELATYYQVGSLLNPNVFHMVFLGLPAFPSVEAAHRVLLSASLLALPLSVLLVIRRIGGNRWFALLSFLLLYNINVSWGFVGFVAAIPLVVLLVAECLAPPAQTPAWRVAGWALVLLLIFTMHALAACFALLSFVSLRHGWGGTSRRRLAETALASLPLAVWMGLWWWRQEATSAEADSTFQYLLDFYRDFDEELLRRADLLSHDNSALYEGVWGERVGLLFSLALLLPALTRFVADFPGALRQVRAARAEALVAFLLLALGCALLLPPGLPGQTHVYERFSVFVLLGAAMLASVVAGMSLGPLGKLLICLVCVLHLALWAEYFADFEREHADFRPEFLPAPGGRLAGLVYVPEYRGRPVHIHFPNYYIVWKRGVATTRIIDYRFGPIRRRAGTDRLPPYSEWIEKTRRHDPGYADLEYLLLNGRNLPAGLRTRFVPVRRAGPWTLFTR